MNQHLRMITSVNLMEFYVNHLAQIQAQGDIKCSPHYRDRLITFHYFFIILFHGSHFHHASLPAHLLVLLPHLIYYGFLLVYFSFQLLYCSSLFVL